MQVIGEDCHARELSDRPSSGRLEEVFHTGMPNVIPFVFLFNLPFIYFLLIK